MLKKRCEMREWRYEGLRAGMAGNPDLTRSDDQKLTAGELVSVIFEGGIEVIDLGLKIGTGKPEKQNARVRVTLVKDQLAKIPIGNDENASLLPGKREDVLIRKAMRVVAGDGRNVMTEKAQVGDEAKVGALIEQEFHRGVAFETAPLGGLGETSSPATAALA